LQNLAFLLDETTRLTYSVTSSFSDSSAPLAASVVGSNRSTSGIRKELLCRPR